MWFCLKKINIGLYSDIYRPISVKLGIVIETTKLHIVISVWMTLIFIQGYSCMRNKKLLCLFDFNEIQYVATTCCFVEARTNFFVH